MNHNYENIVYSIDNNNSLIHELNIEINNINKEIVSFVKRTDDTHTDEFILHSLDCFFMEKNKRIHKVNLLQNEIKVIQSNLEIYNDKIHDSKSENANCRWYSVFDNNFKID
jgi:hypothetical protein